MRELVRGRGKKYSLQMDKEEDNEGRRVTNREGEELPSHKNLLLYS